MHFCPLCKVKASQFIPDYEMIDMISGNTSYTIIPMEKKLEDLELSEEIYVDKVENNIVVIIFFVNYTFFNQFAKNLNIRKNIKKLKLHPGGNLREVLFFLLEKFKT
jgi:hypothetical protein